MRRLAWFLGFLLLARRLVHWHSTITSTKKFFPLHTYHSTIVSLVDFGEVFGLAYDLD